jgi:transposase-like protein
MDDSVQRFRQQAGRELGGREGAERRYSVELRQQAVAYWRAREAAGDGMRAVATALGIAPVSLRRWARDARFRPVRLREAEAPVLPRLVVVVDATGVRVEGADIEAAVQLIARLR